MGVPIQIVRADSGGIGEVLVWLVITVVWIAAQALSRARKKKEEEELQTSPPPPPQSSQQPEDLDEFFKLLRQQFDAGEAKPAVPPEPPPIPKPQPKPKIAKVQRAAPRPPRIQPMPAPVVEPPSVPTTPAPVSVWQEPAAISAPPAPPPMPTVFFESSRRDILSLKVSFSSRGLRLPDIRTTLKPHHHASSAVQKMFHGREGLKKAIIARQVLGPPRALNPWLYPAD